MKHKALILIGTIVASLFISFSFGAGKALATTGCFTDTVGSPFETYICWMLENGITSGTGPGTYSPDSPVTRGQMAVFMQRQAEIPPSTGPIYINAGLNGWKVNGNHISSAFTVDYDIYTRLRSNSASAGNFFFQLTPDLPSSLYGRQLRLHSVKLCYDASNGSIILVRLDHWIGGASPALYNQISNSTVRTNQACEEFILPIDSPLSGGDHVVVFIQGSFASATNWINISSTTFTLLPSANPGVLSPTNADETRPVMQAPQPANGEAGTAP